MDEDKGINTQELYNRIKTGRWSMADADDWRHVMCLLVRLLDPDRLFYKYLLNIESIEHLADFSLVNTQDFPSELLYELVQIWRQLETSPSRSRFGPTVVSLCCSIGSAITSGWIDAQLYKEHSLLGMISKAMGWLDIDEAYIAWRLVILIGEQYPKSSNWDADLEANIAAFWNMTLERSVEYIRIDRGSDESARYTIAQHRSLDDADIKSLDQIFSTENQSLLDSESLEPHTCLYVPISKQTGVASIRPGDLSIYVADVDGIIPDTRLRRTLDTVVAFIAQSKTTQGQLPPFVVSSLTTIHSMFISMTSAAYNDKENAETCDENSRILVFEYVRFLWKVWLLELPITQARRVFRTMSAVVWDRLLSFRLGHAPISSGAIDRGEDSFMSGLARRIYVMTGWLLTRSSPTRAANVHSILDPAVCKLAFSRIAYTIAETAKAEHAHFVAHGSVGYSSVTSSRIGEEASCLQAVYASQALMVISWLSVVNFRVLLHETQTVGCIVSAIGHLGLVVGSSSPSNQSTEFITQSIDNLSVVSIPEESAWNLAGCRPETSFVDQVDILAYKVANLLYTALVDCAEELPESRNVATHHETVLSKAVYSARLATEAEIIPRIVWQACNAAIDINSGSDGNINNNSLPVFSDLASNHVSQLAMFAKDISSHILCWLLAGSYNTNITFGGAHVEQKQRLDMTQAWLELVVSWIVPKDISSSAAIKQHIRLLRTFRTSLLDASCLVEGPQDTTAMVMRVVESCAVEELLGLVQLVCTIDQSSGSASESLLSSFGDRSRNGRLGDSEEIGSCIGELLGESAKLLAFLIHDEPASKSKFVRLGGYKAMHASIDAITQNDTAVACLPLVEGVMALLSGVDVPYSCRDWTKRNLDTDWMPTMILLYLKLSLSDCILVHQFIEKWCKGDSHVCWNWSQSTIARQSIERLQHLFTDIQHLELEKSKRHDCIAAYLKSLGRMLVVVMGKSMCVSDLKLVMRTLTSGPGGSTATSEMSASTDEISEFTLMVRRMLSLVLLRCAEGEVGGSYFSFNGCAGALYSSNFYRIPERGFTFTAWIYPENVAHQNDQQHHLLLKRSHGALQSLESSANVSQHYSTSSTPTPQRDRIGSSGTVMYLCAGGSGGFHVLYDFALQRIEIQVTEGDSRHIVKCEDILVAANKWTSLAVCYTPSKRGWSPFGSSNLYVYADGELASKSSIPFIDNTLYRACYIGSSPVLHPADHHIDSELLTTSYPFCGRIANIRVFDGPLRTSEIEALHYLGPANSSQFWQSQASDPDMTVSLLNQIIGGAPPKSNGSGKNIVRDVADLFKNGDIDSRLILSIGANATHGRVCIDLCPIGICQAIARANMQRTSGDRSSSNIDPTLEVISLEQPNAPKGTWDTAETKARLEDASRPWLMLGDVLPVNTMTIHQSVHLLGGIETALIFLYHLDWIGPALPLAKEGPLGSEERAFDQTSLDCAPLPTFFYWLRNLIKCDPRHMVGIKSTNLVSLIAHVLQQQIKDPGPHLSVAVLRAMQSLQTAFDKQGGLSSPAYTTTSSLWSQVQRELVLNFKIWRRADFATQTAYLRNVHYILCAGRTGDKQGKRCNASAGICGPEAGGGALGIRWLLYALFNFYPYDSSQHILSQQQYSKSRSGSMAAQSPPSGTPALADGDELCGDKQTETQCHIAEAVSDQISISAASHSGSNDDSSGPGGAEPSALSGGKILDFPILSYEETRRLRKSLLNTLESFLSASAEHQSTQHTRVSRAPEANRTDIAHLMRHLIYSCNRDIEHTREILQLLFRCLADGSSNASSLAHKLLGLRGFDMLCHVIECDDDKTAAVGINIVVLLLTKYSDTKEQESTASRITNSLRGRPSLVIDPDDIGRVLALVRAKRALTPALYQSLLPLSLKDHAALLSSINLPPIVSSTCANRAHRHVHHVRNLSVSHSTDQTASTTDEALDVDMQKSFVSLLPARLIKVPEAWSAILDLSCASETDPELRTSVLVDFHRLLVDEPANYETAHSSKFALISHLIDAIVLAGCLVDDKSAGHGDASGSSISATDAKTLSEMYAKAVGHLELIPHTTLDHHMQSLASGHIKAHKVWTLNRMAQLRSSADAGSTCDQSGYGTEELQTRATADLMISSLLWSKTSCSLFVVLAWNWFGNQAGCADDVYLSILKLWALTPAGSMSIAIRLLSFVFSEALARISEHVQDDRSHLETAHLTDWVLARNLESFAQHALDLIFNYRQFQEYIAYHHDQLKAMSASSQKAGPRASVDDHGVVYHSQHSPWDDTPELTRIIIDFMFRLDRCGSGLRSPMCNHILRLVISGIRSVKMDHVEESLKCLARLLERHPRLGTSQGISLPESSMHACSGDCSVAGQVLSTLGYIHEAFMFAEDQTDSSKFENLHGKTDDDSANRVDLRERLGDLYMLVFQGYRAYLTSVFPSTLALLKPQGQWEAGRKPLNRSQFVAFVQSKDWQELYRTRFMPAMRKIEEDEMRQSGISRSRFAASLREILADSQKHESMQMRAVKHAQTTIASNTLPIEAEETTSVHADTFGSPAGHWPQIWRERLRSLSSPRGPWRSARQQPQLLILGKQRWILDATENSQRMRRKLAHNHHYEDHHLAANRRDRTGQHTKANARSEKDKDPFDDRDSVPQLSLSITGHTAENVHDASGDEEWNLVTSEDLSVVAAAAGSGAVDPGRAHFCTACERVAMLGSVYGRVEITSSLLRFTTERDSSGGICVRGSDGTTVGVGQKYEQAAEKNQSLASKGLSLPSAVHAELTRDISWQLSDIHQVHFRRYMLRNSAVEVFFKNHTSVFLNIQNKKALMQLVWKLASLPSVNSELALTDIRSPPTLLNRLKLTERWQHGELSNFDYLMALNTVAGRSHNDLSQYPIFPWVISDYKSKWLDLKDPKIYRDLSRPIGALNEKRLRHFIERYESFEDPTGHIKKFHYGTHYSSASSVAYYLLRLEPFTSVHVSLQSGKFDHADRQFYSVAETWNSCMTGPGDVKELIPEFFYLPEYLVNHNGVDLGRKQDGTLLGDVVLPPWASTPDEFVHINRQALESEYVSANLHKWIDLIFGYKQRGHEAVKAHNVFYYLTYEGAVNLDAIQDPLERASVESQIHYFGQTPTQLFTSPHPPRHMPVSQPSYAPLTNPAGKVQHFVLRASNSSITFVGSPLRILSKRRPFSNFRSVPWTACATVPNSVAPLTSTMEQLDTGGNGGANLHKSKESVTLVDSTGRVSVYQMSLFTNSDYKFQLAVEPLVEGFYTLAASSPPSERQRLALANQRPVAYTVVSNMPELIISAVHFDNTVKCTQLARNRESALAEATPQASLVKNAAFSTSSAMSMTNAYAGAVVGAMSREKCEIGSSNDKCRSSKSSMRSKQNTNDASARSQSSSARSFAGLLASIGGNVGGSITAKSQREQHGTEPPDGSCGMSAPPSMFIPLAARLLETINASSAIRLPGNQTCVATDDYGSCVAVGSSEGSVCILSAIFASDEGGSSTAAAIAAAAIFGSGIETPNTAATSAMAPLLFATGIGDPMNTDIGHTSMAAYATSATSSSTYFGAGSGISGRSLAVDGSSVISNIGGTGNGSGSGKAGRWVLQHVLHGHDAAVLDVAVANDHDIVASASVDGTVSLWTARTGRYLRSLLPVCPNNIHPDDAIPTIACHQNRYTRVERVLISSEALVVCYSVSGALGADNNRDRLDPTRAINQGSLVMPSQSLGAETTGNINNSNSTPGQDRYSHYYSSQNSNVTSHSSRREGKPTDCKDQPGSTIDDGASEVAALHVYTVNGRHLRTRKLVHHLRDIALTKDGRFGVCVNLNSRVAVFETRTLGIVRQFELPACGCSVSWSGSSEQQIIVGCEGGLVVVISADLSVLH
ncbi:hypothetical protein IW140_003634 [Coemansia sp. RSA 1813]|nr:hypothetical protein IW140_003634 [Coemansia sp. RSA 1813]